MNVGILVLAAGRAARFGSDKRMALLPGGRRMIDATCASVRDSGLPFLVCLDEADALLAEALNEQHIPSLGCRRAAEGMGASLAEGARNIPGWSGVLVALADMPWIRPDTYRSVAARVVENRIVVPVCDGHRGHPVGFGREFFPELAALGGDTGARHLLGVHRGSVIEVPVADPAILRDIDTAGDLSSP